MDQHQKDADSLGGGAAPARPILLPVPTPNGSVVFYKAGPNADAEAARQQAAADRARRVRWLKAALVTLLMVSLLGWVRTIALMEKKGRGYNDDLEESLGPATKPVFTLVCIALHAFACYAVLCEKLWALMTVAALVILECVQLVRLCIAVLIWDGALACVEAVILSLPSMVLMVLLCKLIELVKHKK